MSKNILFVIFLIVLTGCSVMSSVGRKNIEKLKFNSMNDSSFTIKAESLFKNNTADISNKSIELNKLNIKKHKKHTNYSIDKNEDAVLDQKIVHIEELKVSRSIKILRIIDNNEIILTQTMK